MPEDVKGEQPAAKPEAAPEEKKEEVKEKKKVREGKKPHKNKPTSQRWKKYKVEGDKIIRAKACPRCGPGIFLMEGKDRLYCGRCHYTEFLSKKETEEKKE